MVEEYEVAAAEPVVAAVLVVDNDSLSDVSKDDDWDFKSAVGVDEEKRIRVKRKLRELQKNCCAKSQKGPTSVAKALTLGNKLLGSVDEQTSMVERTGRVNREEELGIESETVKDEQDESHKVLAGAQMKETRKDHVRNLDGLPYLLKTRESELLLECDE